MDQTQYVSRGGVKLQGALDEFQLNVSGMICADFGCNVGGFTDCLLQRGAVKVYAIDTGYGELAWKLRKDPRVVVMERTNALYLSPAEQVDLVVIDVAWTPQELSIPAAAKWLKDGGRIISLLKPHYELSKSHGRKSAVVRDDAHAEEIRNNVCQKLSALGWPVTKHVASPIRGKGGNVEFLLLIENPNRRNT